MYYHQVFSSVFQLMLQFLGFHQNHRNQERLQYGCRHQLMDRILFQEDIESHTSDHLSTANEGLPE